MLQPLPQLPAMPLLLQDDESMFDNLWTKIAVGTGQVKQSDVDAAKATSNSTVITPKAPTPPTPLGDILGGAVSGITGGLISPTSGDAILHPIDTATSFIFTSRLIFLLIGLLLVGAGLFQFRATQTVIETGTKAVKFGAKLAA